METDAPSTSTATPRLRGPKSALTPLLPEVDTYLHLLVLLHLIDHAPSTNEGKKSRLECADALLKKILAQNRRSMDHIAAR